MISYRHEASNGGSEAEGAMPLSECFPEFKKSHTAYRSTEDDISVPEGIALVSMRAASDVASDPSG